MSGDGLRATCCTGPGLSGPSVTRIDPQIRYDATQSLPPGVSDSRMSIRWTGAVVAPTSGLYTLALAAQGGVRAWVNRKAIVSDWNVHGSKIDSHSVYLVG